MNPPRLKLSAVALLSANAVPLGGVVFFGWTVSSVIILYWFENIVLGVINIARMILFSPAPGAPGADADIAKPVMIPFFTFHYFFFCAGHGIFVFSMFPDEQGYFPDSDIGGMLDTLWRAVEIFSTPLALAALILAASHVLSFVVNYLGGNEYRRLDGRQLMMMPYGRIVVLHVTIIFGGFATMALGQPVWVIGILVLVKTFVDLKMHLREHRKAAADAADDAESEIEQVAADQRNLRSRRGPVR